MAVLLRRQPRCERPVHNIHPVRRRLTVHQRVTRNATAFVLVDRRRQILSFWSAVSALVRLLETHEQMDGQQPAAGATCQPGRRQRSRPRMLLRRVCLPQQSL